MSPITPDEAREALETLLKSAEGNRLTIRYVQTQLGRRLIFTLTWLKEDI